MLTAIFNSKTVYRRLLAYVWPHKYKFIFGVLGGAIYSAIDAYFTHLMKLVLDQGFINKDLYFINLLPYMIVGIFLLRGIANFVGSYFMSAVGRDVVVKLRNRIFEKLTRIPAEFYDTSTSGQLLAKIIYNVDQVADAATNAVTVAVQSFVLIGGLLVVMFMINWRLTLLYLLALPVIAVIVRLSSRRMRRVSFKVQDTLGKVSHSSEELIKGYREVRMFASEKYEIDKFFKLNNNNRDQAMKVVIAKTLSTSFVQLIGACVLAFTMYLATSNNLVSAAMTPGSFVALLFAMLMFLKPLKDFTNVNNIIQQGIAGAQSVFEFLDKPNEIDEGTKIIQRAKGKLEFRDVDFAYSRADKSMLHKINFLINPGETVAVVGRSGSGKSTLISLLPRFYEPQSGSILIDDMNIKKLTLTNLRNQFALVSQRVILFNDTIAHNIAYGSLAMTTEQQLWDAVDRAHVREFIEKLPQGLNTIIGENGVLLSGGQRQRLAIARAILKDAPILILDEATSSLDSHAERHIQAALDDLIKNRTTLVITHRLATIENADRIIVMNNGQIVEIGKHKKLLADNSYYAKLYNSQFSDETSKI